MNRLDRLETWIAQLVEEPFVRLFAGRLLPQDVATHLVRALEDGERVGAEGVPEVPGRYTVALNPDDLAALQGQQPDLAGQLEVALNALSGRLGLRLREPPAILLQADAMLTPRTVRITPTQQPAAPGETRDLAVDQLETVLQQEKGAHPHAYLIIQGGRTFDLCQTIVRIGRALDNDLILEDRRVSRYHAQLRRRYNRYILQDLGSSGGTTANGIPIQEIVLRPGDVISLAGVELIYAEEPPEQRTKDHGTQPYPATGA